MNHGLVMDLQFIKEKEVKIDKKVDHGPNVKTCSKTLQKMKSKSD